jgi:hypothetical protein
MRKRKLIHERIEEISTNWYQFATYRGAFLRGDLTQPPWHLRVPCVACAGQQCLVGRRLA